jgi:dTDP-4-dehydrorhamnose reductase
MTMNTILITGANGQVGQEFQAIAANYPQFHFLFTGRKEMDICNPEAVEDFLHEHRVDVCINCAAYTAVDKAESEEAEAMRQNLDGTRILAAFCEMQGIPLIHLSTDYVYHTMQNTPFKESDRPNPQGVYAKSKFYAEQYAMEGNTRSLVIRTSWVYSSFGNNFVKTMLRLGAERESLNVVFDQIGTPTYARDLAEAILHIIQTIEDSEEPWEEYSGVYNYSNEGVTSWYDFAKAIFDLRQMPCTVYPIESKDFPTPALRPPFSLMDKSNIKTTFNLAIPYWRDSLKKMLSV